MNQVSSDRPLAVVTGASSGIGYALAQQFAENGFDLIVVSEEPAITDAVTALRALGGMVEGVQVDLAEEGGVDQLHDFILTNGRPVDAIAINAGVGVGGPFVDNDLEAEIQLINLNVLSVVRLAKHMVRDMVSRGAGRILFTSSIAAEMPAPFLAVYGASKAFVQSFSEALRNELSDTGVTVTALQPGATDTNFFERAGMQDTKVAVSEKDDPAEVARQGFEAMMAGKGHVVAGSFKNKVQSTVAQVLPEGVKAQQHRKQTEPGSGKK